MSDDRPPDEGPGASPGPQGEGAGEPLPPPTPPGGEPTEQVAPRAGAGPDAVVARANAVTRRTLIAVLAALFLFGSCGIAYGVFRLGGGGEDGVTPPTPSPEASGEVSGTATPTPTTTTPPPGPDLLVSSVSGTQTVVQNVGAAAVGRFVVSVSGRAFVVGGLEPGQSATVEYGCRPGPLTAVADSTGRVEELDETNNALTAGPFDCESPTTTTATTTTSTTTTSPSPTGTERLPDLTVKSVSSDQVVVANIGTATAGPFSVSVSGVGTFRLGSLAAGATRTIAFGCASGDIVVTVDVTDLVQESNERNNVRTAGPFACPDLLVAFIGLDSVTIVNLGDGPAGPSVLSLNGQTFNVPAIPANDEIEVSYPCVGGVIDAFADAFDAVSESNEGNNRLTRDVGQCPVP